MDFFTSLNAKPKITSFRIGEMLCIQRNQLS